MHLIHHSTLSHTLLCWITAFLSHTLLCGITAFLSYTLLCGITAFLSHTLLYGTTACTWGPAPPRPIKYDYSQCKDRNINPGHL